MRSGLPSNTNDRRGTETPSEDSGHFGDTGFDNCRGHQNVQSHTAVYLNGCSDKTSCENQASRSTPEANSSTKRNSQRFFNGSLMLVLHTRPRFVAYMSLDTAHTHLAPEPLCALQRIQPGAIFIDPYFAQARYPQMLSILAETPRQQISTSIPTAETDTPRLAPAMRPNCSHDPSLPLSSRSLAG